MMQLHIGAVIMGMLSAVIAINVYAMQGHPSLYAISGFFAGIAIYLQRKPKTEGNNAVKP
jgi:hypothetical protein